MRALSRAAKVPPWQVPPPELPICCQSQTRAEQRSGPPRAHDERPGLLLDLCLEALKALKALKAVNSPGSESRLGCPGPWTSYPGSWVESTGCAIGVIVSTFAFLDPVVGRFCLVCKVLLFVCSCDSVSSVPSLPLADLHSLHLPVPYIRLVCNPYYLPSLASRLLQPSTRWKPETFSLDPSNDHRRDSCPPEVCGGAQHIDSTSKSRETAVQHHHPWTPGSVLSQVRSFQNAAMIDV